MARFTFPRSSYVPTGAIKVTDKHSDAVVYLYAQRSSGLPCVIAFHGKAQKPDFRYWYPTEEERAEKIERFFKSRRDHINRMAERRKEANKPHTLEVGHILRSSWGYDQTNIDYYQVTAIVGKTMVELRKISRISDNAGGLTGTCTPDLDAFIGEPFRRKVSHGSVTITQGQYAHPWKGTPDHWTAYA